MPAIRTTNRSNPQLDAVRKRRRAILAMLAGGKTDDEIADTVGIARRTVALHVHALKIELGADNRFEIVQRAVERGLVRLPRGSNAPQVIRLTPAELRVLEHVARERTHAEIARRLHTTVSAVEALIVNMRRKLQVRSRVAMIDKAARLGLVPKSWRRDSIPNPLTDRDVAIIRLIDRGLTASDIARAEGTAVSSAAKAIERVRSKVRAPTIAAISKIAGRLKLIDSRGRRIVRVSASTPQRLWKLHPLTQLSPTLLKTLKAMRLDCDSPELARRLDIPLGRVRERCHAVIRALGASSRDEAVRRGVELGFIDADRRSLRERLAFGERHWEVAKLMARGKSCGVIAKTLSIDPGAVSAMQRNIRYKLGTTGRAATVQALRDAIAENR